jgi:hypothetical protein
MKPAVVLQLLSLVAALLVWLAPEGSGVLAEVSRWLAPGSVPSTPALILEVVFGVAALFSLLVPQRWLPHGELYFASGFGVCLGLILMFIVGGRLGILQMAAAYAIGHFARRQYERTR